MLLYSTRTSIVDELSLCVSWLLPKFSIHQFHSQSRTPLITMSTGTTDDTQLSVDMAQARVATGPDTSTSGTVFWVAPWYVGEDEYGENFD